MVLKKYKSILIDKYISSQALRFLVGGTSTAIVCWGSAVLFVEAMHIHYIISSTIATFIAWAYSYLINKKFVFKNKENNHFNQRIRFVFLQTNLLIIGNFILFIEVNYLKIWYVLAIVLMSAITAIINFLIMKYYIFKKN